MTRTRAANYPNFGLRASTLENGVVLLALALPRAPLDAANNLAAMVFAVVQPFAIVGMALLFLHWRGERRIGTGGVTSPET